MRIIITFLIVCLSFSIWAQSLSPKYSRVKVFFGEKNIVDLARLGVEVDHGHLVRNKYIINAYSEFEIQQIEAAGFHYEILIDDLKAHILAQNEHHHDHDHGHIDSRDGVCDEAGGPDLTDFETPENFELGSMAGFYTYQEMLDILDDMVAQYPNLISARTPIDNIQTHEGRSIYWLRISDNPTIDENEPEVFYNALHHAREPASLTQLILYMWYLLENYETDEEVKYLVDNTAMYFVPCVNPDGYIYNELTDPNGGGFWRKNRRNNNDGTFGVDLNRNYDYEWGIDDNGSSPNTDSDTYRGPEGFSEPETQALRDFCNEHEFKITLNYHSFGNLLIYPWGFDDQLTEDSTTFRGLSEAMTRENNYFAGTGSETVGYAVNGTSDDWMYGADTKPPIFSMTPEVGPQSFGFWPPMDEIENICKATLLQNLTTAHLILNFGLATDLTDDNFTETNTEFSYELKRYGLADGVLTVSISPESANIISVGAADIYNLLPYEIANGNIPLTLDPTILPGDEIIFTLLVDNGLYTSSETITKTYAGAVSGLEITSLEDDAGSLSNWDVASNWGITTNQYVSAPSSITDSPSGNYDNNSYDIITLANPVSLVNALDAKLNFWAKWETEDYYDYAQILLSSDNVTFTPACGLYTVDGSPEQDFDQPVYEANQEEWVEEEIDLSDYLGGDLWIRFAMVSDGFVRRDGFYFDDLVVTQTVDEVLSKQTIDSNNFTLSQNSPNPASDFTQVQFSTNQVFQSARLVVYNSLGQVQHKQAIRSKEETITVDTKNWNAGLYFYQLVVDGLQTNSQRMVVVK